MTTTSYQDIGAVQRIETGTPTAKTSYQDMGAVQRQESTPTPPSGTARSYGFVMG